jgi:LAO/AO transport system kinase
VNKNQSNNAALRENKGVSNQEATNKNAISNLKRKRKEQPTVEELLQGILDKNTTALSRGITLIESHNIAHQTKANTLIEKCLEHITLYKNWNYRSARSWKKHLYRGIRHLLNQLRK